MISIQIPGNAMSYSQYRSLIDKLAGENKTTGPDQSEEMVAYGKLNLQRMQRLEKTVVINEELKAAFNTLGRKLLFVVITEGWCGDAAQNVPVFAAMESTAQNLELKLLLRDEHPELMSRYLTNGAKAIPKLICLDNESMQELFLWGPRPKPCQDLVMELKARNADVKEKGEAVHLWYARDKSQTLQKEILQLINSL